LRVLHDYIYYIYKIYNIYIYKIYILYMKNICNKCIKNINMCAAVFNAITRFFFFIVRPPFANFTLGIILSRRSCQPYYMPMWIDAHGEGQFPCKTGLEQVIHFDRFCLCHLYSFYFIAFRIWSTRCCKRFEVFFNWSVCKILSSHRSIKAFVARFDHSFRLRRGSGMRGLNPQIPLDMPM